MPRPEWIALVECTLDTGALRHSFHGASPANMPWYDENLTTASRITRSVPLLPGESRISDGGFTVFDFPKREYATARASTPFRNRLVKYRFGDRTKGLSSFIDLATGRITAYRFAADGNVAIQFRDGTYDRFRNPIQGRVNSVDFPYAPGSMAAVLWPIIYGNVTALGTGLSGQGACPCYRVDPGASGSFWEYLVARHPCRSVVPYKYGVAVGSGYSIVTRAVAGRQMTFLRFTTDPRDPARPNEFEITADVEGVTYESIPGGTLITNPIDQLKHFMKTDASAPPVTDAEIGQTRFNAASAAATAAGYVGAFWIGDSTGTHNLTSLDVINEHQRSFGTQFFMTRTGMYGVAFFTAAMFFALGASFPQLTDDNEIFRDSFDVVPTADLASQATYQAFYNFKTNTFEGLNPTQVSAGEAGRIGLEIPIEDTYFYVRDLTTAHKVAATKLLLMAEGVQIVHFTLPPEHYTLDLNDFVAITHSFGPGKQGYKNTVARILEMVIDLTPLQESIQVTAAIVNNQGGTSAHSDTHSDQHADAAHADSHSDAAHNDFAHTDSHTDSSPTHGDAHNDTHGDNAHLDSTHADSHSDNPGGGTTHSDAHTDRAHTDTPPHADQHYDIPAEVDPGGTHGDYHNDVNHTDITHLDIHNDFVHGDGGAHGDSHADASHSDSPHSDSHGDTGSHTDGVHQDIHGDVAHQDAAHTDLHSDQGHQDTMHGDFHSDATGNVISTLPMETPGTPRGDDDD